MTTPEQFRRYLAEAEGEVLEFKEARRQYEFDELVRYCVALANEGGGKIILGVTDRRPRTVVGTKAFAEPGRTASGLHERLGRRVQVEEYDHEGARVLIFDVPARPPGTAWSDRGTYWMRAGDSLVPMSEDQLKDVHREADPDFSAEPCYAASSDDLDPAAIDEFRQRWANRSQNSRVLSWPADRLLADSELSVSGRLTNAALLLFGRREVIGRHLPQAEVIFEYRSNEAAGPPQDRENFREGFLLFHDRLWTRIDRRNDRQSYQQGFFRYDIPTFDEAVIREAVLNAFCHRDYRRSGSVFVRQFARRMEVNSPGGLPPGITPENILDEQNPRNRRLAEALEKCGLIERSGQGMNLMFEHAVRESKPLPDLSGSAAHEVRLTLQGTVTNPAFIRFLEKVGEERLKQFDTHDLLVLDLLQRGEQVPERLRPRLRRLLGESIIEAVGRGRGTRYILSRRLYEAIGQRATYTRRRGLDDGANKELLVKHLQDAPDEGTPMSELRQVLPTVPESQVKRLLQELRDEGRVRLRGTRRWARWFAVPTAGARES